MRDITLSINPTYYCNFSCEFCYLTPQQLKDTQLLDINKLNALLDTVNQHANIKWVDLYGGEVGTLKDQYYSQLKSTIRKYYNDKINIVTNFSMTRDWFFDDDTVLSVSYDFDARQMSDRVLENIMLSSKPIALLILASNRVTAMDVDHMINILNMCASVESVEIKPYSINQANHFNVSHRDFENFVQLWLDSPIDKRFEFVNQTKIEQCLAREYNAFSDDHLYITPSGKFAVLEFDANDREFFLELDTFDDYIQWAEKEKQQLSAICKSCPYVGHCLTEHYRYVKDLTQSCNGYRFLLENYERRMEN